MNKRHPCQMHELCSECLQIVKDVEETMKPKKRTLFHVRKHFSVYFKLWSRLDANIENDPMYWEEKSMSWEILYAYLEGRKPNWHLAFYLPWEERERRNKTYKKK